MALFLQFVLEVFVQEAQYLQSMTREPQGRF